MVSTQTLPSVAQSVVRSQSDLMSQADLTADWSRPGLTLKGGALSGNWAAPLCSPRLPKRNASVPVFSLLHRLLNTANKQPGGQE